jgi:hypothetical protein
VCEIDCLVCQEEFVVNIPFDVKENVEHALEFACLAIFGLGEFGLSV